MEQFNFKAKQPRRKFLRSLVTACAGIAALLTTPRRATAKTDRPSGSNVDTGVDTGPILYRRTEEAERYYRTLYR